MKEWRINSDWELKGYPFVINGEKLFNYGIYDLKMHAYNCDEQMSAYCRFFHAVKIPEINVILGYPWLHTVNSGIDWKEQAWQYPIDLRQVSIVDLKEFALKMEKIR